MLTIPAAQMARIGEQSFEEEMRAHLCAFSPALVKTLGQEGLSKAIRFGVGRAAEHNFTFRGPVRLYLESMFLFGSHFDTDPQYPWAAQSLAGTTVQNQMSRAQVLYRAILEYRNAVAGPDDRYTFEALRNIRRLAHGELRVTSGSFSQHMLAEIEHAYPQKAHYVGRDALQSLFRAAALEARRHALVTVRGAALVIVMMLAFGHGCMRDPLYPWIARSFGERADDDVDSRVKRLEARAITWLDHVLKNLDPPG